MKKSTGLGLVVVGIVAIGSSFLISRTHEETFTTKADVNELIVENRDMAVKVVGVSGDQTQIHYQENNKMKYDIEQDGEQLIVKRRDNFWFNMSFFNFTLGQQALTIEVPKDELADLQVKTSNDRVETKNLDLDQLDVKTTNGKVGLENLTAKTIEATTSNSQLTLNQTEFTKGTFKTSNAQMELTDLDFKEGQFKTTNAAIELDQVAPKDSLSLTSSNGKITGTVIGQKADFAIRAETSNGSNNLSNKDKGNKDLNVQTSNASIEIEFVQ